MFKAIKDKYNEIVAKYFKGAGSILNAWITAAFGLLLSVSSLVDWSPLFNLNIGMDFNWKQVLFIGVLTFIKGVFDYGVRIYKSNELK